MDKFYSEEDLVRKKGDVWGEWTFSLTEEELSNKILSLPTLYSTDNTENEPWSKLFSDANVSLPAENVTSDERTQLAEDDEPMECSSISINQQDTREGDDLGDTSVEDLSVCLVDTCNQAASKLKLGLAVVQEEMKGISEDLGNLTATSLISVMNSAWTQLPSDPSKLCFCTPFFSRTDMCEILCKIILYPWLSKSAPSKLEVLSLILSTQADTVCRHLLSPLLQVEDSPFVKDLMNLEDLMTSMTQKDWSRLLKEVLSNLVDVHVWIIPVLAMIVEQASPSTEDLQKLVRLMSYPGTTFQTRDFGSLLVAVVSCVKEDSLSLVPQLKLVANNYNGSLKIKALKMLNDLGD